MTELVLDRMTSDEIGRYFAANDTVLLAVGCDHAHAHIPVGIDNLSAWNIAQRVGRQTSTLVLPQVAYGYEPHYADYPGTISLPPDLLRQIVTEIGRSLHRWGIRKMALISGHGGNKAILEQAAIELRALDMLCPIFEWWVLVKDLTPDLYMTYEERSRGDTREVETSVAMALGDDLVDLGQCRVVGARACFGDSFPPNWFKGVNYRGIPIAMPIRVAEVDAPGEIGSGATAQKGERILTAVVDFISSFIEEFKQVDPRLNVTRSQRGISQ